MKKTNTHSIDHVIETLSQHPLLSSISTEEERKDTVAKIIMHLVDFEDDLTDKDVNYKPLENYIGYESIVSNVLNVLEKAHISLLENAQRPLADILSSKIHIISLADIAYHAILLDDSDIGDNWPAVLADNFADYIKFSFVEDKDGNIRCVNKRYHDTYPDNPYCRYNVHVRWYALSDTFHYWQEYMRYGGDRNYYFTHILSNRRESTSS